MTRISRALLLALATTLAASRGLRAQCSGGQPQHINNFTVTPTALNFGTATTAQFNTGWVQSSYTVTVRAPTPWIWFICVQANSANMGTVSGYTKPIGDLQWSLNGSTWTSVVNGVLQPITSGTGNTTITVFVRTLLSYGADIPLTNATPGTYSANLSFRVSM
jgi:hypothetical protein